MSSSFDGYHDEFERVSLEIQQALANKTHPDKDSINSLISQANDLIKQMSIEARGLEQDDEVKQELLATVQSTKTKLAAFKQELQHQLSSQDRASLFSATEQVYSTREMAHRQVDSLERARATMAETEQVGAEITTELARNRETLGHTQQSIGSFSSLTDRAAGVIKTMSRRRGIKD